MRPVFEWRMEVAEGVSSGKVGGWHIKLSDRTRARTVSFLFYFYSLGMQINVISEVTQLGGSRGGGVPGGYIYYIVKMKKINNIHK